MLSRLLEAMLFAWAVWVVGNFILLSLSAWLAKPNHPCFNGFRIVIPGWLSQKLSAAELAAVIAHEEGHRDLFHVWENFALVCIFSNVTPARRREQELEADDFAIAHGHAVGLASALLKLATCPSDRARIERIVREHAGEQ